MAYTTVALVSEELNGLTINSSTIPSSTSVQTWISQADSQINMRTGKVWESTVASSVLFDSNGTRYFRFPQAPVISISTFEYEQNGLGAESESWVSLTEGRNEDYILYVMDGEIQFTGKSVYPVYGKQNIRTTYTYGYSTTPAYIQRLSTLMVASRIIETIINDSASEGGGSVTVGNISITDPGTFGVSYLNSMKEEMASLWNEIGDTEVYRPSRVYELRY
jgi:hypothetical protein